MRERLMKMHEQRDGLVAEMEAIHKKAMDEDRDLGEEEQKTWNAKTAALQALDAKIQREQALLDAHQRGPTRSDAAAVVVDAAERSAGVTPGQPPRIEMPEPRGTLMCFSGERDKRSAAERAYRFGRWLMAIGGHDGSKRFCRDYGIKLDWVDAKDHNLAIGADYNEGTNSQGGYLVLPEFDRDIIRLVLQYGVFRRNCRVVPMTSDEKTRMRRTGGLTAYFVGEGAAGTKSNGSWDIVKLIAKKLMVLSMITNELNADAIISMADNLAFEVAQALSYKEDYCGFYGDGTSTCGGIVGLVTKLIAINGVIDGGGGQVVASGNLFSEFKLDDHMKVIGRLPTYAEPGAKWYCHKFYKATVMDALAMAAGGNTVANVVAGVREERAFGYPVEKSELFPKADSNSQVAAVLADLRLAADLGDRMQMTMAMSDSATVDGVNVFETDQFAIRATERFDINVHDVGTSSEAGPAVALVSAAS